MSETLQLERLQRRFWELIIAPYGVEEAVVEVAKDDPDCVPLQSWIKAPDEETAIQRLDIYANMYFFRLVGILEEQFASLASVLGHDTFTYMCADFFQRHPPTNFALDYVGDELPTFLEEHSQPELPWLVELALLERARYQLIAAPDSELLTVEDLQQIPPETWGEIRFQPISALRLLEFEYPVHRVWRATQDEAEAPPLEPEPTTVLVWRHGFTVRHQVLSPEEKQALLLLLSEALFEEICLSFFPGGESEDVTPEVIQSSIQLAYQTLAAWVQDGMLCKLH